MEIPMQDTTQDQLPRILVTGTSSGFGFLISQTLADAGYVVFAGMRELNGRNAGAAEALRTYAAERGLQIQPVDLDVTSDASVRACAEALAAAGGVDSVVQNAGVAAAGLIETFTAEAAHRLFDVNVFGPYRVLRALLPQMRERGGGRVVYISSTDGREVMPFLGIYNATKAALESLAEGWRYELNAIGIKTVIVQPGTFPTTSILSNLVQPDASERATGYGDFASAPDQLFAGIAEMIESGAAPDPQLVAVAVARAFEDDAPLRIPVDPSGFDGAARVNAVCDEVQSDLLERFGLSSLLDVQRVR
jgi:NAD(P)-dependent dehydrogenase (short-subunit alcohol dehydrogenase family)